MLSYMQAQIEVVRQQSADTALEMRSELASIKDLQGFLTQKQSIAEQSNSHSDPGGSSSGVSNRVPRDAEPPDITDNTDQTSTWPSPSPTRSRRPNDPSDKYILSKV